MEAIRQKLIDIAEAEDEVSFLQEQMHEQMDAIEACDKVAGELHAAADQSKLTGINDGEAEEEVENLRKQIHEQRVAHDACNKVLDELRATVRTKLLDIAEAEDEVDTLREQFYEWLDRNIAGGSNGVDDARATVSASGNEPEWQAESPEPPCSASAADWYTMYELDSDVDSDGSHATLEDTYRQQVLAGGPDDGAGNLLAVEAGKNSTVAPQAPPSARLGGGSQELEMRRRFDVPSSDAAGGHRVNDEGDSEKHDLAVQGRQLADAACVDETPAIDDDGSSGTTEAEHDTSHGAIARSEAVVESGTALANVEDRQVAIPRSPRPRWADIDNEDAVSDIAAATSGAATGVVAGEGQCSFCLGDPSSVEDHCCFCLGDGRAETCTCQDPPFARLGGGVSGA